jgi:hypothetical protein
MKEQVRAGKTFDRYRQVIRDFVNSLGNRANLALSHITPKDLLAIEIPSPRLAKPCGISPTHYRKQSCHPLPARVDVTKPADSAQPLARCSTNTGSTNTRTTSADSVLHLSDIGADHGFLYLKLNGPKE